jgi:aldehyde:ferredoxin oxidoreductase
VSAVGIMVPGPGHSAVDMTGNKLDRDKFTGMLKEYYALRGWDEETGQPRTETLAALGVADLLPSIVK